ncbi:MAG: TIM barrel protein [Gammaproteobacteria bacterium]|nr:TIM barrel protein [Gammaproteobacteria bacterium]
MFRFCASLGALFQEIELPRRFAAAREQGFEGVELTLPYAYPAQELATANTASGTEVVLFTAPLGNFMSGGEGIAAVAGKQAAFRDSVALALDYAQALDARFVQFVAGRCAGAEADPRRREHYLNTYVENLHYAVEAFAPINTRILVEAINSRDFPDYLLSTPAQVREVTRKFAAGLVAEVFDSLHLAVMGVDPVLEWRNHAGRYAHVQLADAPDRSPPGSGTLDFPALFREIAASGYQDWLSAEYRLAPKVADSSGAPGRVDAARTSTASSIAGTLGWIAEARTAWEQIPH